LAKSLGQQLAEITRKYEIMLAATAKEAAQNLTNDVQTSRSRGGNLPVDLGFLANSFSASLNSVPSGPSEKPQGYVAKNWNDEPVALVINRLKIGDRLVMGYTANYAPYMEARYAFVRSAAQNWDQHVKKAIRAVKGAIR
jgi:hypothetical protein